MIFTVHTNVERIRIDAKTPDEARKLVLKKHPNVRITKVKVAGCQKKPRQ